MLTWTFETFAADFAFEGTVTSMDQLVRANFGMREEFFIANFTSETPIIGVPQFMFK